MNTQSNAMPEYPSHAQESASALTSATLSLYWSVRRELWENRAIYIAPLAAAGLFLFGVLISMARLRHRIAAAPVDLGQQQDLLFKLYEISGGLIMGTAFIVGIFYSLDALYGERRDRSILFWKSLPVSDLTAVLSKVIVPLAILPLLSFVITIAAQLVMLVLSSVVFAGTGVHLANLWTGTSFLHVSLVLLYHIVTVHGLWYAPFYGWLLLVSAWAPRAPFIWAFLPPFVICGVEKLAFNTTHCLTVLQNRLTGPAGSMASDSGAIHPQAMHPLAGLIPAHFFSEPGLWIGLLIAAALLAVAVRLRRRQGPI